MEVNHCLKQLWMGKTMTPTSKILVLDDDPGIHFFLEELLERDGHEVACVESGEQALRRVAAEEFDLALIDLKLQGISGTEVLKRLHMNAGRTLSSLC